MPCINSENPSTIPVIFQECYLEVSASPAISGYIGTIVADSVHMVHMNFPTKFG